MQCPRCRSATSDLMAHSKPEGLWSVYLCNTCLYTWRTSEPASATDANHYDPRFRIKPEEVPGFRPFPIVPPRKAGF